MPVVDQVDLNFRKMAETLQTSGALGDSGRTITAPAALVKMISIMPAALRIHERIYNEHQTLVQLRDEMRRDAARIDSSAAAGLKSFAVRNTELDTLKAEIALLKHQNGRGRDSRHQLTAAQRMAPDCRPPAGTPWPFKYFCTKHGHSTTHDDSGCYVLHPELRPKSD